MKKIKAHLIGGIVVSNSKESYSLCEKRHFGEKKQEKVNYSLFETFYLIENKTLDLIQKEKILKKNEVMKKFQKLDKDFLIKYFVFEDLRSKGHVTKTALKFGADFRVYEKSKRFHSKWLVFVQKDSKKMDWKEFASKNRVAHSTKKNLLLAIVDEEGEIIYYEFNWIKP